MSLFSSAFLGFFHARASITDLKPTRKDRNKATKEVFEVYYFFTISAKGFQRYNKIIFLFALYYMGVKSISSGNR